MSFCEHLFCYNKQIELYWKTDKEWGNRIQLQYQLNEKEEVMIETIAKCFVDVYVENRLSQLIKDIIRKEFYYTNRDEIERIQELTDWIIRGNDKESRMIRKQDDPNDVLKQLFMENMMKTTTLHFDSIVKFQITSFRKKVQDYVGLAIDEFKQEEDHQAFIDMLRKYIEKQKPVVDEVHIVQGSSFSFFKESGKRFTELELRKMIQQKPLYIVGLGSYEFNLTPLVAMAPRKIKIYGDNPSEPKTLTIINVFQEKVTFVPYDRFPFTYY